MIAMLRVLYCVSDPRLSKVKQSPRFLPVYLCGPSPTEWVDKNQYFPIYWVPKVQSYGFVDQTLQVRPGLDSVLSQNPFFFDRLAAASFRASLFLE